MIKFLVSFGCYIRTSMKSGSLLFLSICPQWLLALNLVQLDREVIWKTPFLLEENFRKGKLHVRLKRRNGRIRVMCKELLVELSDIKFTSVSTEDEIINQRLLPKFNLQLSEKERTERAKVVLPFEHQANGKAIQIYDGRRSLNENYNEETLVSAGKLHTDEDIGKGQITYFRDSDDEMPDSDEDPDDELDI